MGARKISVFLSNRFYRFFEYQSSITRTIIKMMRSTSDDIIQICSNKIHAKRHEIFDFNLLTSTVTHKDESGRKMTKNGLMRLIKNEFTNFQCTEHYNHESGSETIEYEQDFTGCSKHELKKLKKNKREYDK
ncbi:uncharacterized protein LOC122859844 [Aphidius gifuensis]|uniref:uncharacterized protein LOC122859844 n=1 Tax=Aphidius gifuensis TaxID=684658 RepID=UPI001CDB809B|nr:uncharacterized protein LOC122859844 [Aphidius gifuensis]